MCRVFGCVAAEPVSIRHELIDAQNPLIRQSEDYAAAWRSRGLTGRYLPLSGHEHFSILEELPRPDGAILGALRDLALART